MKNFYVLFIICLVFLNSCRRDPIHIQLVNKQIANFAEKVSLEENFVLVRSGGGLMDNIKSITLYFYDFQSEMNIGNARKLIVRNINDFLYQVNENVEIRPYLNNYPFSYKNLEFNITFKNRDMSVPTSEYVVSATLFEGEIIYQNINGNYNFRIVLAESFEDALEKIQVK